jgi:hypothetical protein
MPKDVYDEALRQLAPYHPEFREGLTNHGAMSADALWELGRGALIVDWVESYAERLEPLGRVPEGGPGPDELWPAAGGDIDGFPSWLGAFRGVIAASGWREVLELWLPRFTRGYLTSATHGLLATAHATRALRRRETPERRESLARALAYWASTYLELPRTEIGEGMPSAVAEKVPRLPDSLRPGDGLITDQLRPLLTWAPFAEASRLGGPGVDLDAFHLDLTRTAAAWLVAHPDEVFAFLHGLTSSASLHLLGHHLTPSQRRSLLEESWIFLAALVSGYAQRAPVFEVGDGPGEGGWPWDDFIARAVASGDEHAIKVTEAARREELRRPDPIFGAAARTVLDILAP